MIDTSALTTAFINSGIGLAILGYLGYLLKGVPGQLYFYVSKYVTTSLEVNTSDPTSYEFMSDWARENFPSLKRHIQLTGYTTAQEKIADGVYYCIKDKTLCIIRKYKLENKNSVEMEISLTAIGLHEKRIIESCRKYIADRMPTKEQYTKVINQGNGWSDGAAYHPKRNFSTVFSEHVPAIKEILDNFINNKENYLRRGLAYKTGFLFYGEPGTGKSTMARAIAGYMNWPLICINNVATLKNNGEYQEAVVLFEDIDCLVSSRDAAILADEARYSGHNTDSKDGMQKYVIHKLLNFLDGTNSPENVIFVATTNYIDALDPAIVRPGRFDHKFECKPIDRAMAERACDVWEVDHSKLDGIKFPTPIANVLVKVNS